MSCILSDRYRVDAWFPVIPSWGLLDDVPGDSPYNGNASQHCLMHWEVVRKCYCKDLTANILKKVETWSHPQFRDGNTA